jgi:2-polyprenyl-3-methyl-5-hydroxy-6-metoxy-1,4-benzoquinol methylase
MGLKNLAHDRRIDFIRPWIEGRRVLDLGCVDHSAEIEGSGEWMHKKLTEVASSVTGIDILEEDIARLRKKGYDVRVGDVQNLHLGEKYEVVFAGEIIEHLVNFESFLKSVKANLIDGGVLIVTTPNVFSLCHYPILLAGGPSANPEHTCWFDSFTLSTLLVRFGFEVVAVKFIRLATSQEVLSAVASHDFKMFSWKFFSLIAESLLPQKIGCRCLIMVVRAPNACQSGKEATQVQKARGGLENTSR